MNSINPAKPRENPGWAPINRPTFTNGELMKYVSSVKQVINNTPEEIAEYQKEADKVISEIKEVVPKPKISELLV